MTSDKALLSVAIIALVVSMVGAGITYNFISSMRGKITGFATDAGYINLTVESSASINFTTEDIDWGSGRVNGGEDNATLNTAAGASNMTRGNWTGNAEGFIIENIGNVNVTINFSFGTNADGLLGGTGPAYLYNVSANEAGSCLNSSGGTDPEAGVGLALNDFYDANTTTMAACGTFLFNDSSDQIRVDLYLAVPSDSFVGALTDTITATFESA